MSDDRLYIINKDKKEMLCIAKSLGCGISFINKNLLQSVIGKNGLWKKDDIGFAVEEDEELRGLRNINTENTCVPYRPDYKTRIFIKKIFDLLK